MSATTGTKNVGSRLATVARWAVGLALLAAVGLMLVYRESWLPGARAWIAARQQDAAEDAAHGHVEDAHVGHDHEGHDHAGHDEANSLELSEQARRNIGLKVEKITLRPFERTIGVPGLIVERPGRSAVQITAPLTGVITRFYPILGQAVSPGETLFEIRLTHEELVQAQSEFLRTAEELDVIQQEIDRLTKVAAGGTIAGKVVLERKYERQKQLAVQHAQHQALLLHGFSEAQVNNIQKTRTLLQTLTVRAPEDEEQADSDPSASRDPTVYQVRELDVQKGQHVTAGDRLARLSNHAELLIEGNAFEQDMAALERAAESGAKVSAIVEAEGKAPRVVRDLEILYLSGEVDRQSRAFHFYVRLPNRLLRRTEPVDGHRFVYWLFKPGQRVQLQVPVETWSERIVLPVDAVAQDGVETYVFQPNGDHFDRRPVHVEHRDQLWAVIANDGTLFPGEYVAVNAAQQLQQALKNKSGGAIDPHAGHNH
jgi:multidrug efflux pump subunit AcrA (membrane-fusion protein)